MKRRLVRARAPLRLGIGGGGTDVAPYCDDFGGVVLNAAINRFCHVTLEPSKDGVIELSATDMGLSWRGEASTRVEAETGAPSLMRGVYNRIVSDFHDNKPLPVRITSYADAPVGSGLGTSSAMVVALLAAFRQMLDLPLGAYDLAHLAYEIEREDLGFAGGKQDQYAAAFGGINFMEFHQGDRVVINPLRIQPHILTELESSLVIYFTGKSRESAKIIEEQQANMVAKSHNPIDSLHSLKHSAIEMKEALLKSDIRALADLLVESWEHKKKTASRIATAQIDEVYQGAMQAGALGGKVSGAGGGGFMMFLIDPKRREHLIKYLSSLGGHPETCQIFHNGVEAWRPTR